MRCGSWKESSHGSACGLDYGATAPCALQQPASSTKSSPKFPWGLRQHSSGTPYHPCEVGSSLVPLQGEMRVSICWVWQESGADTSPEAQAELPCSLTSHHHWDPKTPPAPTPHSLSMGQRGQAQHPSLALDTGCKAAPSASVFPV